MTDQFDYRKGRNLSALSFLIIVYVLSGAELQDQGMMLGVVLQIEHTEVITYAVIALFVFSAYQFGIEMTKPNHRTSQRLYKYLYSDKALANHVQERAQAKVNQAKTKEKLTKLIGRQARAPSDQRSAKWKMPTPGRQDKERPAKTRSLRNVTVNATAYERPSGPEYGDFEVEIDPLFYYRRELRALFFSVFYHPEAWEDLFPLILALSAYILILYNWVSA